jgi:predicted metalloprotease
VDPGEFDIVTDGFRLIINECGTRHARELLRQPLRDLVRHWRKRWWQFLEYAVPPDLEGDERDIRSRRLRTHAHREQPAHHVAHDARRVPMDVVARFSLPQAQVLEHHGTLQPAPAPG